MRNSRLKTARADAGLFQYQLGGQVGINPSRLSRIENRHVEPTEKEKTVLAAALEVDVDALFGAEENGSAEDSSGGTAV